MRTTHIGHTKIITIVLLNKDHRGATGRIYTSFIINPAAWIELLMNNPADRQLQIEQLSV